MSRGKYPVLCSKHTFLLAFIVALFAPVQFARADHVFASDHQAESPLPFTVKGIPVSYLSPYVEGNMPSPNQVSFMSSYSRMVERIDVLRNAGVKNELPMGESDLRTVKLTVPARIR